MRSRRPWWVVAMLGLATPAHANAAMPYAYQIFYPGPWWVYVIVTVLFEAWVMGRILKRPFRHALVTSLLANAASSLVLYVVTGPVHLSEINPDPLLWSVEMLSVCAVVSALLEGGIWAVQVGKATVQGGRALVGSFVVHTIGVPLGLLILLAPEHPYPAIDSTSLYQRRQCLDTSMRHLMNAEQVAEIGHSINSLDDLVSKYPCRDGAEAALYVPHYARWDRHEMKRERISAEWHSGIRVDKKRHNLPGIDWLWRQRLDHGLPHGWIIDRSTASIWRSTDPVALRFDAR